MAPNCSGRFRFQPLYYNYSFCVLYFSHYMPRVRSQYIAEMRERFEVVDRVKASAEEKASLTKAIHEDEISTSPEASPSKENTLKKDDVIRLSFKDDVKDHDDVRDEDNDLEQKDDIGEDDVEIVDEEDDDIESGLKVLLL